MARKISHDEFEWINEKEAAGMLGYKYPRTLRDNAKTGNIPVVFRTTNGRRFQYSKEDIQKYQLETSTAA